MEEAGPHTINIEIASEDLALSPNAIRIIQTPFEVPKDGTIEVASISQSVPISLPTGSYALRFEYFVAADSGPQIRFVFIKAGKPSFEILRVDNGLSVKPDDLLLSAEPA